MTHACSITRFLLLVGLIMCDPLNQVPKLTISKAQNGFGRDAAGRYAHPYPHFTFFRKGKYRGLPDTIRCEKKHVNFTKPADV
jgi:hypothetical protein